MHTLSSHFLAGARGIAEEVLDRGDPPEDLYTVLVGAVFLYLSADPDKITGLETLEVEGTVFHLGFRGGDVS
jgi:CRP-like cAMP-binding protein